MYGVKTLKLIAIQVSISLIKSTENTGKSSVAPHQKGLKKLVDLKGNF